MRLNRKDHPMVKGPERERKSAYEESDLARIEKAYGNCRLCYGKGYATLDVRSTKVLSDGGVGNDFQKCGDVVVNFCECDRGKQLSLLFRKAKVELGRRILELIKAEARNAL